MPQHTPVPAHLVAHMQRLIDDCHPTPDQPCTCCGATDTTPFPIPAATLAEALVAWDYRTFTNAA